MKIKALKKLSEKRNVTRSPVCSESNKQRIQILTSEMEQLKERECRLAERLIAEQPLVNELRSNPRFLKEEDRLLLSALVDDIYNNFTVRLTTRFPNLTEVDIQYCILLKLHFSVPQVAILSAISRTSVYQQKARIKKRLLLMDPNLFINGKTLDAWLHKF